MTTNEQSAALKEIIANANADDAFKKGLLADPIKVLEKHGVTVPEDMELFIAEDADANLLLELRNKELSEQDLDEVSGGMVMVERVYNSTSVIGGKTYTNISGCGYHYVTHLV